MTYRASNQPGNFHIREMICGALYRRTCDGKSLFICIEISSLANEQLMRSINKA